MLFKFTFVGDETVLYIPPSLPWQITFFEFDDDNGYNSIHIFVGTGNESKSYQLRWRESLDCDVFTESEIAKIYKFIIERVWKLVADGINFIDIDRIESDILQELQYPEVQ